MYNFSDNKKNLISINKMFHLHIQHGLIIEQSSWPNLRPNIFQLFLQSSVLLFTFDLTFSLCSKVSNHFGFSVDSFNARLESAEISNAAFMTTSKISSKIENRLLLFN